MIEIKKADLKALINMQGFYDAVDEYAKECAIAEMPPIEWDIRRYLDMEAAGFLKTVTAYDTVQDEVAGFALVIALVPAHYSVVTATCESLFMREQYRGKAGTKLIKFVEDYAKELGAVGLFLSAPAHGAMARLMPAIGYANTNTVYFKRLNDASC